MAKQTTQTETTTTAGVMEPDPEKRLSSVRSRIFAAEYTELKVVPLPFNGEILEFRQPAVGDAEKLRSSGDENDNFIIRALINGTYLPGTDVRVFADSDYETLNKMPMGGSFQKTTTIIMELLDLNIDDKVKN